MIIPSKKMPGGDIGVVLLGRLAVDKTAQGIGLGRLCMWRAFVQVESASHDIGIHALIVDALDQQARNWYLGLDLGFETLRDNPNHLYIPLETIRRIVNELTC
jgi:GNAT superfamily N-acetyltransferase